MSDPITPNPKPAPPAVPVAPVAPVVTPAQDDLDAWKQDARKWETRAKSNKSALDEALKKVQEFEDQSKTELEKALARADAAEKAVKDREDAEAATASKAAQDAELAELVADVAKAKALDASAVAALRGSTREELEAHADILKPLFIAPAVIPDPGKTPDNKPSEEAAFVRSLFGGQ